MKSWIFGCVLAYALAFSLWFQPERPGILKRVQLLSGGERITATITGADRVPGRLHRNHIERIYFRAGPTAGSEPVPLATVAHGTMQAAVLGSEACLTHPAFLLNELGLFAIALFVLVLPWAVPRPGTEKRSPVWARRLLIWSVFGALFCVGGAALSLAFPALSL